MGGCFVLMIRTEAKTQDQDSFIAALEKTPCIAQTGFFLGSEALGSEAEITPF